MAAHSGPLRHGIVDRLRSLADGRWWEWRGLSPRPSGREVEHAFGSSLDGQELSGMLGGSPTMYRRYPPTPGAPHGVTVWFEGEAAVAVEIRDAVVADGGSVGDPDASIESALGDDWSQDLHAAVGLVLHRNGPDVGLLFALAPFTVEDWMHDPLRFGGGSTRHRHR